MSAVERGEKRVDFGMRQTPHEGVVVRRIRLSSAIERRRHPHRISVRVVCRLDTSALSRILVLP